MFLPLSLPSFALWAKLVTAAFCSSTSLRSVSSRSQLSLKCSFSIKYSITLTYTGASTRRARVLCARVRVRMEQEIVTKASNALNFALF